MSNHLTASNSQTEAKQTSDIDFVIEDYQELVHVLSVSHTPAFPDSSLTMAQMKVLMLLSAGESRMSDLAHQLHISPSTLSSLVERLVESDLVHRRADERDRRNVLVSLTPAGTAMLDTFQELGVHHLRSLLAQLDAEQLRTVNQAVSLLTAAARRLATSEDPR